MAKAAVVYFLCGEGAGSYKRHKLGRQIGIVQASVVEVLKADPTICCLDHVRCTLLRH
jgi:hypothetical protein